jgi:hypothetical protein
MRPTACTVRGACNPPITPFPSNRKTAYRSTVGVPYWLHVALMDFDHARSVSGNVG